VDGMADALGEALAMPLAERRARYRDMIAQLRDNNVSIWRDNFLRDLNRGAADKPRAVRARAARKAVVA